MRAVLISLTFVTAGLCVGCSHQQRPLVSPAAAKRAIQRHAGKWSSGGKIVDLSCRQDPDDPKAITCDGSPVECQGGIPIDRWSVHRGRKGQPVVMVGEPEQRVYCIVNTSPGSTTAQDWIAQACQSQPYLICDASVR